MTFKQDQGITWKVAATVLAIVAWGITTGIIGWNLRETIRLGQEVARIETKLDMPPLANQPEAGQTIAKK